LCGVLWLRAADAEAVLAGNDDAVPVGINLTQRTRIDREGYVRHCMGCKMHAGEPGKHVARTFKRLRLRHVKLDDFIPCQRSAVFDIGLRPQGISRSKA